MESSNAGVSAGPPPVGSLGCYKGVMLCTRPPEGSSRPQGQGGGEAGGALPPFRSTVSGTAREQKGLPPAKDAPKREGTDVKTRGPSAALRRHCQWIRELQEQVRQEQQSAETEEKTQEERKERMQEAFKRQRDAIRIIKSGRDPSTIHRFEIEAILMPHGGKKAQGGRGAAGGGGEGASHKPLWAMTEAEKESFEDEEADDLIRFAEDIDFDRYINDLEFRQGLQAVRDRAKKLQREQDAFKSSILQEFNSPEEGEDDRSTSAGGESRCEDSASRTAGRRPAAGGGLNGQPDWDASTACGEDRAPASAEARQTADRVLEANPQLRQVHSKGSVQKLIEKARQGSAPPNEF